MYIYINQRMENVMFGDVFANIRQLLSAASWYNLAQTCHRYNLMFTKNDICDKIVDSIKSRLRDVFGAHYDECIAMMRAEDVRITGTFITQCILGEKWMNDTIILHTHVMFPSIGKLTFKDSDTLHGKRFAMYITGNCTWIDMIRCMNTFYIYDVQKNIYDVTTGKIHIRSIEENVYKYTNVPARVRSSKRNENLPILYEAGFKFYRSVGDPEIMNLMDLIHSHNDVINVAKKMKNKKLRRRIDRKFYSYEYWIHKQKIWTEWQGKPEAIFDINSSSLECKTGNLNVPSVKRLQIKCCKKNGCFIESIEPDLEHYHCTMDEPENSDDDVVLIVD